MAITADLEVNSFSLIACRLAKEHQKSTLMAQMEKSPYYNNKKGCISPFQYQIMGKILVSFDLSFLTKKLTHEEARGTALEMDNL